MASSSVQSLASPNYPSNYGNNEDLTWTIYAPAGTRILLNFLDYQIEDYFDKVYIGKRPPIIWAILMQRWLNLYPKRLLVNGVHHSHSYTLISVTGNSHIK